jgi:predicted HicB family RNase H-like nuclease
MDRQEDVKLQVRMPVEVHERMRQLAEQHERSLNGEIIWALRRYIQEQEGKGRARSERAAT